MSKTTDTINALTARVAELEALLQTAIGRIRTLEAVGATTDTASVAVDTSNDYETFRTAFFKLANGRILVRICNLRRELGWNTERFDTLLDKLWSDGVVQCLSGDRFSMTEEDVRLNYIDKNNDVYETVKWINRQSA
jgi:hypothetical protein